MHIFTIPISISRSKKKIVQTSIGKQKRPKTRECFVLLNPTVECSHEKCVKLFITRATMLEHARICCYGKECHPFKNQLASNVTTLQNAENDSVLKLPSSTQPENSKSPRSASSIVQLKNITPKSALSPREKKVNIVLHMHMNRSQEVSEYIRKLKESPNSSFDPKRKPLKSALKPNLMPGPIHPFYKKKICADSNSAAVNYILDNINVQL